MDIHLIVAWFKHQNWFVLSFAIVGWLNVIVAGARVMGWNQLADFCGKLEDAIQAMVTAALNRKQNQKDEGKPLVMLMVVCFYGMILGGCAGYRLSHVTGVISGSNIATPYGPANANLNYDSTTCVGIWGGKCP